MPNYGSYVICPFYRAESKNGLAIFCESAIDFEGLTGTAVRFEKKEYKKGWQAQYCCTYHYDCCPYADKIREQYRYRKESDNEGSREQTGRSE